MGKPITEWHFRKLVGNYVVLESLGPKMSYYRKVLGGTTENVLLTYCYIDHMAGITFEVLSLGTRNADRFLSFGDTVSDTNLKIRYSEDLINVSPQAYNIAFYKYYDRVKMIDEAYSTDALLNLRKFDYIDSSRHEVFPDDVGVIFYVEGCRPERIWVRMEDIIDGQIYGTVLNQPNQAIFGVNAGDTIPLSLYVEENDTLLFADI